MIDNKELQLGNLVRNRSGEILRVDFIARLEEKFDTRVGQNMYFEGHEVRPLIEQSGFLQSIPVSEKNFLQDYFGFDELGNLKVLNIKMPYQETPDQIIFYTRQNKNSRFLPIISQKPIKYIHELQNLYYSLTGDNLKTLK